MNEETNTPETLAAVLAEMKRRANEANDGLNGVADINQIDYMEVEDWASRIEAAAKRERAKYERLHECFWNVDSIQNIVRQMLDEREDLRDQNPKASESIGYFAQLLTKAATHAPGNAAAIRDALKAVFEKLLECAPTAEQEWPELVKRARTALERKPEENYGNAVAMRAALMAVRGDLTSALHPNTSCAIIDAALAAPARNCDRFATVGAAHKAWRATDQERDFADWLFDKAEGGAK